MWGQRNSKYAAAVGSQLLAKIHVLDDKVGRVSRQQNHPIDCLDECIDFVGEASDHVGKVDDELNSWIDTQDVQIEQLANMVNDLARKTENCQGSRPFVSFPLVVRALSGPPLPSRLYCAHSDSYSRPRLPRSPRPPRSLPFYLLV
jgi:hypothetical protein